MLEDYEKSRRKQVVNRRSLMDYGMGFVFSCLGIAFLLNNGLEINIFTREPSSLDYVIGGLFLLYGLWRFYRGYKKNYFK